VYRVNCGFVIRLRVNSDRLQFTAVVRIVIIIIVVVMTSLSAAAAAAWASVKRSLRDADCGRCWPERKWTVFGDNWNQTQLQRYVLTATCRTVAEHCCLLALKSKDQYQSCKMKQVQIVQVHKQVVAGFKVNILSQIRQQQSYLTCDLW